MGIIPLEKQNKQHRYLFGTYFFFLVTLHCSISSSCICCEESKTFGFCQLWGTSKETLRSAHMLYNRQCILTFLHAATKLVMHSWECQGSCSSGILGHLLMKQLLEDMSSKKFLLTEFLGWGDSTALLTRTHWGTPHPYCYMYSLIAGHAPLPHVVWVISWCRNSTRALTIASEKLCWTPSFLATFLGSSPWMKWNEKDKCHWNRLSTFIFLKFNINIQLVLMISDTSILQTRLFNSFTFSVSVKENPILKNFDWPWLLLCLYNASVMEFHCNLQYSTSTYFTCV